MGWTATEWAALGSVLSGAGTVVGGLAVIGAAWFGSRTFESWRRQALSERRIEQAERILTAAYKARRALAYVRGAIVWAHELAAAEEQLAKEDGWASAERKQKRKSSKAYFNRLDAVMDERKALDECLPMARALFGEEVEVALETLNHQFHIVGVAADMTDDQNDADFARSLREDLSSSAGNDRPNKMNDVIAAQVKLIEDACLPTLRLVTKRA